MASIPKTPSKTSDSSMSGWVVFSIIGHLIVLLFLSMLGPKALSRKSSTPLQRKQVAIQKEIFDEQNKKRLSKNLHQIQEMHDDLLGYRNRRIEQYKKLEERMQRQISEQFSKDVSGVLLVQQQIKTSLLDAKAHFDSLRSHQQKIKKNIKNKNLADGATNLLAAQKHLEQLNISTKKSKADVHVSIVRLENIRELLLWLNNDSLLIQLTKVQQQQAQLQKELTRSTVQLGRYEKLFQRNLAKIKNIEKSRQSPFKTWEKKRRMKSLASRNIQKHDLQKRAEQQEKAGEQLEKSFDNAQKKLSLGLPSTQFAERRQQESSQQSSVSGLFQNARSLHEETAEIYREARAAELALLQNRTFSSTYEQVSQDFGTFSDNLDDDMPETVTSNQDFRNYRKSFEMAARDMDLIYADIQAMRQKAAATRTTISDSGLTDIAVLRRHVDQQNSITQRAGPLGRQVQDLSADMFQMLNPNRLTPFPSTTASSPPQMQLSVEQFGRKITRYGKPVQSFFINSWYMIGPFPNAHRRHINDLFPPESIIDLDATYVGKHSRPLKWEYCSSSTHFIKPIHYVEYGIYYAYTELFIEHEQSLWMAFGSDDRLDVWINDIKVWQSSNNLKQWRPDEGYRKVYLKEGYNKILARLENGYRECGFSIIVSLEP